MTTFDGWETQYYGISPYSGQDVLAHFRTKGSKNGVRRYQNPDGSWTPLGLRERKEREGWGESRRERRAAKKIERTERRQARQAARAESRKAFAEKMRKRKLKNLTDEELQAKIKRAQMEQEYRELTKKGTVLETGAKLIGKYLEYRTKKEQQIIDRNKQTIEMERLKTERVKATEATRQERYKKSTARSEAKQAKQEARKMESDVKGGLKIKRKKELVGAKLAYRNTTIRGAIGKYLNAAFKGKGEADAEVARGKSLTREIIGSQKMADAYNKTRPKGQKKIQAGISSWERQESERDHAYRMEREKTKQAQANARTPRGKKP